MKNKWKRDKNDNETDEKDGIDEKYDENVKPMKRRKTAPENDLWQMGLQIENETISPKIMTKNEDNGQKSDENLNIQNTVGSNKKKGSNISV